MSDNLNIKLLKQHAAILETVLQTVTMFPRASRRRQRPWMRSLPPSRMPRMRWWPVRGPRSVPALLRRN